MPKNKPIRRTYRIMFVPGYYLHIPWYFEIEHLIHNMRPTMAFHAQAYCCSINFDFARPVIIQSQQLQLQ